MRRIAILLILVAAVVGLHACAADAPTNPGTRPPGGGNPGGGGSALQIQLITNDANPKSGTCALIEAIVTLNGNAVPDGTSVNFSTDFGAFSQNGLPLVSVVTQGGSAVTSLCGPSAGTAKVKATATVSANTGSATLTVVFQPDSATLSFVSSCSPSFGPKEGNTLLTLNGGRLSGTPATTRVSFTVNGVSKDGIVQSVSANQIQVLTPAFTEFGAPQLLTQITVYLGSNVPPIVLSLPSCFSFGAVSAGTPTITSLLPSGGTSEGGTRVTIVGAGFSTTGGVQVFFGTTEATVISVSYNQIVVLSPRQFGDPTPVAVTVRDIASGVVSNALNYEYTLPLAITAWNNNVQPLLGPFAPVTIHGRGFQAPVAVSLAGFGALVQSVSATEIVVIPGPALPSGCSDVTGDIGITNINTGASVTGGSFTYQISKPVITGVSPGAGGPSAPVTLSGINFPTFATNVEVKFGGQSALLSLFGPGSITVLAPASTAAVPTCTGTNTAGTLQTVGTVDVTLTDTSTSCSVTVSQAFQQQLPCVVPPTPTP